MSDPTALVAELRAIALAIEGWLFNGAADDDYYPSREED